MPVAHFVLLAVAEEEKRFDSGAFKSTHVGTGGVLLGNRAALGSQGFNDIETSGGLYGYPFSPL